MAGKKTKVQTTATTVVSFGCLDGVCVPPDQYPLHLGSPGAKVRCVPSTRTSRSSSRESRHSILERRIHTITQGTCTAAETVAPAVNGTKFKFTLKCLAGCPTPAAPPEMIVP